MARKSQRLSGMNGKPPVHKRAASATEVSAQAKRSKKNSKATPTKSRYFESGENGADDETADELADSAADPTGTEDDASEFGSADELSASAEKSSEEDEYESDDEPRPRKKSTPGKGATATATIRGKGSELWRPGVSAGLGPGTQVVIKKPKARPAGKTPYSDETIHPNTLLFLQELKENNDRQWLKMHDPDFRQSEKDWFAFVEKLTEKLIEIDDTVPELPVKDVIFRIYRDVRFSSDPTPYKVSPNNQSFIGGGLWHPEAAPTAAMRQSIDSNPRRIKDVLLDANIRKEFLGGASKNESKAVKAFTTANAESALKTKPKGYDADHADIELLRLRNYTIGRKLADDEVLGSRALDRVAGLLAAMKPFITYLNSVVMPDEAAEDSSSGDDDDEDEAEDSSSGNASGDEA